ncbi:hypothetical protein JTE90_028960 [Oedothorax gibbosus]|uniref:RNA-directed DNA polymerase n=1 Tax=Oedothorax gibbosus TaxID=931172 RepID=A0AAV6VKA8_9ARAC|nr:hypothetical protein JTE90_028960 [Oedothorax gibbosus]
MSPYTFMAAVNGFTMPILRDIGTSIDVCRNRITPEMSDENERHRFQHFFWPQCYKEIEDYVRSCDRCQRVGKPFDKKKAPMKIVPVIQEVFSKINVVACGPLPVTPSRKRYMLTAMCLSSKYPDAVPVLCLESGSDWEQAIYPALFALKTVTHESTGFTSAELVHGKNLRTPLTLLYDKWLDVEETEGHRKNLRKLSETNYVVQLPGEKATSKAYHVNMLKPYYKRPKEVNYFISDIEGENDEEQMKIPCVDSNPNILDLEEMFQDYGESSNMNEDQIVQIKKLVWKYMKWFSKVPVKTELVMHDIELSEKRSILSNPYRTSPRQNAILKTEIQKMLDLKIIEIGFSDCTSPMILVEVLVRIRDLALTIEA